jgi:hypothetical protein
MKAGKSGGKTNVCASVVHALHFLYIYIYIYIYIYTYAINGPRITATTVISHRPDKLWESPSVYAVFITEF